MSEQREWFEIDYSKSYTRDNHRGEAVEFDGFLIPAPSDLLSRTEWEDSLGLVRQERSVAGQNDDGSFNGKDYVEERFVTWWVTADAAVGGDNDAT